MAAPLFPDEPLPARTIGLPEFVQLAEEYSNDEDIDRFLQFVLAGRAPNTNPNVPFDQRRIFVNPEYDSDFPDSYTILGDFDSVIGLSHTLPFRTREGPGLTWHLYPLFSETLTTSVHIKWPIVRNNATIHVPLHKIPNYMCFKFGTRHQGRLFFPKLYDPQSSPAIDLDFLANIYNVGVRPALIEVARELAVQWPVSFQHVSDIVRSRTGQHGAITKDIPSRLLKTFATELLQRLADFDPNLEDAFFEIEAKGVKAASAHNPEKPDDRDAAFASVLYPIDISLIPDEEKEARQWFIDVALEVHAEGRVMQWLTASHPRLIQYMLPSITLDQAAALKASVACKEDLSGHLAGLSGFRLEPGRRGRADDVSYLNVYTTDKSATYQLHEGIFRRRTGQDLLPKPFEKFLPDVDTVANTFAACAGFKSGVLQNGAARMEARVALQHAKAALTFIPEGLITSSILAVDSAYWWYFKFFRTTALYRLFKELASYPPDARSWPPSLMLGAVAIYMFNAIIYRPSEKRIESELARQCAFWCHPHIHPYEDEYFDANYENVNLVPCTSGRGLYFIAGLYRDETHGLFRLDAGRQLDRDDIAILYKKPSIHEITKAFGGRSFGLSIFSRSHKDRTSTRRPTVPVRAFTGQLTLHDFALGQRGVARIPRMQMTGPDVDTRDDPEDDEATLDHAFSELWAQFPSDVIQCSPNFKNRNAPAYVNLSQADREAVSHELYKSRELPFDAAYLRLYTEEQWKQLVFDKFFPPKGTVISNRIQNFRNTEYFTSYNRQINDLSAPNATTIREELWNLFRGVLWLPQPASDRMWSTKAIETLPRGWKVIPPGHDEPAVHIAINATKCPDLSNISLLSRGNPRARLAPEREEEDDDVAWSDLARRLARVNTATHGDSTLDLQSVGPLLESIRRQAGGGPGVEQRRSPSVAGSSASQAGGARRDAIDRREEEEESSSGVEVGRALSEEPVDVFSIGLRKTRWSPEPSRTPPLQFPSSPDLVDALLFEWQPASPSSLDSSPASQRSRKRRRVNAAFDPYAD